MRKRILFLLLLALAVSPRPASADPLQITTGVFALDIEVDTFVLRGDGFSLRTNFVLSPGSPNLFQTTKLFARGGGPLLFPPFAVEDEGQIIDWGFETTGGEQLLGRGDVVLDGISATNVDFVGSMRFDAVPMPLSSGGSLDFEYVAPFSFQAMIRGIQDGEELFSRQFIGSGRLSVNYEGSSRPGSFGFADETILYEFASAPTPVPEPGTLLLLGSGLAGAVLRRRRKQT